MVSRLKIFSTMVGVGGPKKLYTHLLRFVKNALFTIEREVYNLIEPPPPPLTHPSLRRREHQPRKP